MVNKNDNVNKPRKQKVLVLYFIGKVWVDIPFVSLILGNFWLILVAKMRVFWLREDY